MQKPQELNEKAIIEALPKDKLAWQKPALVELSIRNTESGDPPGPEGVGPFSSPIGPS